MFATSGWAEGVGGGGRARISEGVLGLGAEPAVFFDGGAGAVVEVDRGGFVFGAVIRDGAGGGFERVNGEASAGAGFDERALECDTGCDLGGLLDGGVQVLKASGELLVLFADGWLFHGANP